MYDGEVSEHLYSLASFSVHGGTLNVVPAPQFSLGLELNPTPDKVSAEAFLIPLC